MGVVRRGVYALLEEEADRLIKEQLKDVTKHSEKSDILTPWKQAERYRREVYPTSGIADNTRKGNFNRVINPTKPHLNSRDGTAPRGRADSANTHRKDYEGGDEFGQ